jgi:putative ABC transport system permease protein
MLVFFAVFAGLLGYLASIYITITVSRIRSIDAIKSSVHLKNKRMPSRAALVVFQFSIMIGLLSCLIVMQKQLLMVRNTDLGYRKEQLLSINIPQNTGGKYMLLKGELKNIAGVENVSGAAYMPPSVQYWICSMKNPSTGEEFQFEEINGDFDLVETLGIEVTQGRSFSHEFGADTNTMMINEAGLRQMGIKDPLDLYLVRQEYDPSKSNKTVIGVFRDFHIRSLYEKIEPMAIFLSTEMVSQMAVRLSPRATNATLDQIKLKWKTIFPEDPIQYTFVDEALHLSYLKEDQAYTLISLFSFLSFVIALLGLFGLSAFAAERRTKEIGIRKVNGAMAGNIFYTLCRQFGLWIAIAFIVALPVAWFTMHRWLQHFAYRTGISWWIFLLALLVSILVAGLTISWQTYRAANRNPVDALRYE